MTTSRSDEREQLALELTPEAPLKTRPESIGHTEVEYALTRSILTRATGFMADYDFTLNPYSGCGFGCTYCYAAFFAHDIQLQEAWGRWVKVKTNALDTLRRMKTPLGGKSIYMSSVTDPYQPIERHLELVRDLLVDLAPRQPRLVVQTRSPLVTRDVDLFQEFDSVRVNMTVTTDSETVRKAFEPTCPSNAQRLAAIAEVTAAGVPTSITMTPLLPVEDPVAFAQTLVATGVQRFVVQPFHVGRGRFVAGTGQQARNVSESLGWDQARYSTTVRILRGALPTVLEGKEGFAPD